MTAVTVDMTPAGPPLGDGAFREIVVPVDLTRPCDTVLAVAAGLSKRGGVPMRIVMVASPGEDQTANRADLAAVANKVAFGTVVSEVIESNDVVSALLETAGTAGLVCLPTRAHGAITGAVLGGTATDVLLRTATPVLLVGPHVDPDGDLGLVDVCVEDPLAASALVDGIGRWAQRLSLRLRIVHARGERMTPADRHQAMYDLVRVARRAMDRFGVDAEAALLSGSDVAAAIVEDAARYDVGMIAVGVHPASRLRRKTLGSVAMAVTRSATAAVLAVPVTNVD